MLINTLQNKLEIKYKQQVTLNKVRTGKGYTYQEITIPTELIRYYTSITHKEIQTLYYVLCNYNDDIKHFITPFEVTVNTDVSLLYATAEDIVTPERVVKIHVKIHGNKVKNPRYFFRLNDKFIKLNEDYVEFTINPYAEDPVSKIYGLCELNNLIVL